jgi:hypothetical protein
VYRSLCAERYKEATLRIATTQMIDRRINFAMRGEIDAVFRENL